MYRVSPATYLVGGIMSNAVANSNVTCADREILHMIPIGNLTCEEFLGPRVIRNLESIKELISGGKWAVFAHASRCRI
jgi:ABC-type multidrug transport system permease subunit